MRALIKECKLLGVALNPIIGNNMILDVIAIIVWFITSWSLHRIFATTCWGLDVSGLYAKCEAYACVFKPFIISPPLKRWKSLMPIWQHFQWQLDGSNHHLGVNDGNQPCAARPGYHLKGSYHQVIKKLVAELDRSVLFVRASGFLPLGCCWQSGLIWMEGVSLQKRGWQGDASQGNAEVEWIDWCIDDIWNPKTCFFSWNILTNV